jgi:MFS family permease
MGGALLAVSQLYLTVPLLGEMTARYRIDATAAAWVGTAFGLAYAVGSLIFGTISDRFDPRRVMAGGLAASAIATMAPPGADRCCWLHAPQGATAAAILGGAASSAILLPNRRAVGLPDLQQFRWLARWPGVRPRRRGHLG